MVNPDVYFGRLGNRMFQMAYIYAQNMKGAIPDIYVQNPVYFEDYAEEIKNMFRPRHPKLDKVAIHVRRGDYVDHPFYVDLTKTDYYQKAMAEFPGSKFLVFSDDIPWCKEQKIFKDCEFSEGFTEIEDMDRMSACKGVIIANSSFSWWGAYLSSGAIIAPLAWYTDGVERTKCPKEWKRI